MLKARYKHVTSAIRHRRAVQGSEQRRVIDGAAATPPPPPRPPPLGPAADTTNVSLLRIVIAHFTLFLFLLVSVTFR